MLKSALIAIAALPCPLEICAKGFAPVCTHEAWNSDAYSAELRACEGPIRINNAHQSPEISSKAEGDAGTKACRPKLRSSTWARRRTRMTSVLSTHLECAGLSWKVLSKVVRKDKHLARHMLALIILLYTFSTATDLVDCLSHAVLMQTLSGA